jgi:hypothetical protein
MAGHRRFRWRHRLHRASGSRRHQTTLAQLQYTPGDLLAVNASAHEIYALGTPGLIAITPPRGCWVARTS